MRLQTRLLQSCRRNQGARRSFLVRSAAVMLGMRDDGFGATFPCDIRLSSTDDDEFEDLLNDCIAISCPGLDVFRNRAFPIGAGRHGRFIRPDLVAAPRGTGRVFLVADAKRRKRIGRPDLAKLSLYRRVLQAERAFVFLPATARLSKQVATSAKRRRIEILRF